MKNKSKYWMIIKFYYPAITLEILILEEYIYRGKNYSISVMIE